MGEQEDFEKAFNATTAAIVEGKTGAGADTTVSEVQEPQPSAAVPAPVVPEPVAVADPVVPAATPAAPADPVVPAAAMPADPIVPAAAAPADPVVVAPPVIPDPAAPVAPAAAAPAAPAVPVVIAPVKDPKDEEISRLQRELEASKRTPVAPAAPVAPVAAVPVVPAASAAPAAPAAPELKPFEFAAEDKSAIDEYEKEWPDHAKANALYRKQFEHNLLNGVKGLMTEILTKVEEKLDPVVSAHIQSDYDRHWSEIDRAHPDFDQLVPQIQGWIKNQPAYVQPALTAVMEGGKAQDIIALANDFKKAVGSASPQSPSPSVAQQPAAPAAPAVPAAPAPAASKVAALSVVPASRGGGPKTPQQPAEDDFESAYKKTVEQLTAASAPRT